MNLVAMKRKVAGVLSKKRYEHTLATMDLSIKLAKHYGECDQKAAVAALLHDIAKEMADDQLKKKLIAAAEGDYLNYAPLTWHAPVGAILAKEQYQMADENILNAIKYHCTGRPRMSKLEQIIFLADYIEPGRAHSGVEAPRKWAFTNLELAVYHALANTIDYLSSRKEKNIHPDTLAALNFYQTILGGDTTWIT